MHDHGTRLWKTRNTQARSRCSSPSASPPASNDQPCCAERRYPSAPGPRRSKARRTISTVLSVPPKAFSPTHKESVSVGNRACPRLDRGLGRGPTAGRATQATPTSLNCRFGTSCRQGSAPSACLELGISALHACRRRNHRSIALTNRPTTAQMTLILIDLGQPRQRVDVLGSPARPRRPEKFARQLGSERREASMYVRGESAEALRARSLGQGLNGRNPVINLATTRLFNRLPGR